MITLWIIHASNEIGDITWYYRPHVWCNSHVTRTTAASSLEVGTEGRRHFGPTFFIAFAKLLSRKAGLQCAAKSRLWTFPSPPRRSLHRWGKKHPFRIRQDISDFAHFFWNLWHRTHCIELSEFETGEHEELCYPSNTAKRVWFTNIFI